MCVCIERCINNITNGEFLRNGGHCPYCTEEWRNFQCGSWFGGCCQGNKLFLQTASPGKR